MNWLTDLADAVTILEGVSPYLLMILVLVFILWRDSRVVAPAMRSIQQGNKTQLTEWREIIATQERLRTEEARITQVEIGGLKKDLESSRQELKETEERLGTQISALNKVNAQQGRDLEHLKEQLAQKERLILALHEELNTTKKALSDEQEARRAIEDARQESEKKREELESQVKELRERLDKVEKVTNGDPKELK